MIDATYGHLARDAEDQDRGLLDAYDTANGRGHAVGTDSGENGRASGPENEKTLRFAGPSNQRAREDSNL
jgi:hypothetical protein